MTEQPHDPLFRSQPRGFTTLFLTELFERFSYYGMRAILVLFLVEQVASGGFGLDDATATAIYGLYTAGVYIMSMPGGWVADRLIGAQRAVLWGGIGIALGHLLLAIAGWGDFTRLFLLGLVAIVLGTGLLKPNISALVGQLHDARGGSGGARDAGFTWFYIGINIGAMLAPGFVGWLRVHFGWHVGFLAAAVGMAAGLVCFSLTRNTLGDAGRRPGGQSAHDWRYFWIVLAVMALLIVLFMTRVIVISPVVLRDHSAAVIVTATVAFFLYLLFFAGLDTRERKGIAVLLVLVIASTLFWAGYEQAGSSLTLFAERHTNRVLFGWAFSPELFQSISASFVLLFGLLFALLWSWLARRGRDINLILKFALGLAGMALGFLVMAGAARVLAGNLMGASGGAGPMWLISTYLLHTLGELCLSPVGLSATTQLAPKRYAGQAMGLWFTSLALGNLFASQLAGSIDNADAHALGDYFMRMFGFGIGGTLLLLVLSPFLKRWIRPRE